MSWIINVNTNGDNDTRSYIGGQPSMPDYMRIPQCALCGCPQTFYFQIAFPYGAAWDGKTLAVFACTRCSNENHLVPEMLPGPLGGVSIPNEFLNKYQTNFSFLTFNTQQGRPTHQYTETIKFCPLQISKSEGLGSFGSISGRPHWLQDDETPGYYASNIGMKFLLEVRGGFQFEIRPEAPPQMDIAMNGTSEPSSLGYYYLFNENHTYFFGTEDEPHLVYVITQVD